MEAHNQPNFSYVSFNTQGIIVNEKYKEAL